MLLVGAASPITSVVVWLLWIGLTIGIIRFDAARQSRLAKERGEVDFIDRSLVTYMVLALCCAPAPLIGYFGFTRKNAMGWLLGLGVAAGVLAVTMVVAVVVQLMVGGVH
jgi:hypothetical protein